jgi:uncharacterized membrane protein YeaQ/YmgE (transglycosylase-associated protein family)
VAILVILIAIILLFALGIALVGLVFKLLWFALVGLVIGALARLVLPGQQNLGLLATSLYGIGGSLLGGIVADVLDLGTILGFLTAVVVAACLIVVVERRRARTIF